MDACVGARGKRMREKHIIIILYVGALLYSACIGMRMSEKRPYTTIFLYSGMCIYQGRKGACARVGIILLHNHNHSNHAGSSSIIYNMS